MQIKCPHCNQIFNLDESESTSILTQIRNRHFEQELDKKVKAELKKEEKTKELEIKNARIEAEQIIQAEYNSKIKNLEKEVEYYKNHTLSLNNKMIGESLELWCETEFNKIRMSAYPNAYFEKDNKISKSRSKGDYIFRNYVDGVETISIMFEIKNEMENTKGKKKKNEQFFKELDKDRTEKGCEYAVLVSMLEQDSEYYNQGIVDVSYKYQKMYVVRPQQFLLLISILNQAAMSTVQAKKDLIIANNQNLDISNFENKLLEFKNKFSSEYDQAQDRFDAAIAEIDKSIAQLESVKANLIQSGNSLRLANSTIDSMTIKRLCENNPTMQEKFGLFGKED